MGQITKPNLLKISQTVTKPNLLKGTAKATTGAGTQIVSSPSAASAQNVNTAFANSGKTRDVYDAAVRSNYAEAQKTGAPVLSTGNVFADKVNANLNRTTLQAPLLDPVKIAAQSQANKVSQSQKMAGGAGRGGEITTTQAGFSPLKLAGGAVLKGTDAAMSGLTSTAQFLVGNAVTEAGQLVGQDWSNNPITALNNRLQKAKQTNQNHFQGNVDAGGKNAKLADELGTATVAAIPQALLALATAGGSTTTKGLEAVAAAAGKSGILNTIGQATSSMLKDPQYWLAFLQVAGDGYDEAKADGASDREAYLFALSNGMMNAMVEVGGVTGEGGIQSLPQQLQEGGSAARKWIKTMLEEGKENVVQGIIERGLQNVVYQKGNALASVTDQGAILNPKTAAGEFASGAVVGGILGGGQLLDIMPKLNMIKESPDTISNRTAGINLQNTVNGTGLSKENITPSDVGKTGTVASNQNSDIMPKLSTRGGTDQETIQPKSAPAVILDTSTKSGVQLNTEKVEKPDILEGIDTVTRMEPVKQLTGEEFKKSDVDLITQVSDYFNGIGNRAKNPQLGDVILNRRGAKSDLAHGFGRKKAAAFAAVKDIIENGRVVDYQTNWKGRGYDTAVVAAPITIGEENYMAGVVMTRNRGQNAFYVHEVLTTDEGTSPFKTGMALKQGITTGDNAPSVISLLQKIKAVKNGNMTPSNAFQEDSGVDRQPGADYISEASEDYLDNLAKDKNEMTEPVTAADRAKAELRDRLFKSEPPPENSQEPVSQADLDDLVKLYENVANPITDRDQRLRDAEKLVSANGKAQEMSTSEKAEAAQSYFMRKMVDAGDSVTKIGKLVNDPHLYSYYNMARASASAGVNMIQGEQTDVTGQKVGESLNDIFVPIQRKGEDYYKAFQLYMYHLHNIDRMSIVNEENSTAKMEAEAALSDFDKENPDIAQVTEERLRRKAEGDDDEAELAKERIRLLRDVNRADKLGNKPVFDYSVTAQMSQETAERLLREHPEFAGYQKQVRSYIANLMQYRVDSGLMTQEDADFLEKYYPNYVPTFREQEKDPRGSLLKSVRIGKTVGRAVGGTEKLLPLNTALGRMTMKTVREGSKNRFGENLLDVWQNNPTSVKQYIQDAAKYDAEFSPDTFDSTEDVTPKKANTFSVYQNGKMWEMQVDPSLFEGIKALSPDGVENNVLIKAITAGNDLFKRLVTGYNPMFTVRNTVRDLQTAGLYSRNLTEFSKNYPLALREIAKDGEYWKRYKALGGVYSSVFDYQTGTIRESSKSVQKTLGRMEAVNMAMEQAPRLAEFMSIVKSGDGSMDNLMDAMHAAADVTVNFGRSGTLGHILNKTYVPFLNPGIQGFDRMVRRVTETKGGKEWSKLVIRAASLGVAPTLLNALLYRDDKDWDDLKESDKDTNYIFKIGDGVWLKIPKGRELSVLGMGAQRIKDLVDGKAVKWGDFITTVGNQIAPANPLKTNIVSAFADSALFNKNSPGKTWYGGDIESQRLQNYTPGQRYDSSTDIFSKWIGGQLNLSPKKINYILDQYSGVLGDFVLPLLTPQAERDPFTKSFTVDSVASNHISGDFYDKADEITYAKNAGDTSMQAVNRFWNKQVQACSDIYTQIRETEDSDLSDSEKKQKVREAQIILNGIQKNALATVDTYQSSVEKYLTNGNDVDTAYREANRECFGAEYALQTYNQDVYDKAQQANSNGVSYDDYYRYYFGTKSFESTDEKSVNTQKEEYLEASKLSDKSKTEIYFADLASDSDLEKQESLEKDAGIGRVQYWQYKDATGGITSDKDSEGNAVSGSKKQKVLEAIDGLSLTSAQKTALYYAEGYAESTLKEAPWLNRSNSDDIMPKLTK